MEQDTGRTSAEPNDDRDQDAAPAEPPSLEPEAEIADETGTVSAIPAERMTYAEMLEQLSAMARQVAEDAPPTLRDASAVAAIFGATAARSAGPLAHTLADATDTYGNRLADSLEAYAERMRESEAADGTPNDEGEPKEP